VLEYNEIIVVSNLQSLGCNKSQPSI